MNPPAHVSTAADHVAGQSARCTLLAIPTAKVWTRQHTDEKVSWFNRIAVLRFDGDRGCHGASFAADLESNFSPEESSDVSAPIARNPFRVHWSVAASHQPNH
jgi:hypothetical protein